MCRLLTLGAKHCFTMWTGHLWFARINLVRFLPCVPTKGTWACKELCRHLVKHLVCLHIFMYHCKKRTECSDHIGAGVRWTKITGLVSAFTLWTFDNRQVINHRTLHLGLELSDYATFAKYVISIHRTHQIGDLDFHTGHTRGWGWASSWSPQAAP